MPSAKFNPNSTAISGLEWYPTRRLPRVLKVGSGIGVEFASTATETIAQIVPWLTSPNGALVGVDIYNASTVTAPVVGGLDVPGIDIASSAGFEKTSDSGTTWAAYTTGVGFVDLPATDNLTPAALAILIDGGGAFLRYKPTGSQGEGHLTWQGTGAYTKITDGTSGNDPSSSRVGWVEINIVARAHAGASATIDSIARFGASSHGSDEGPRRITPKWARYTFHYYWNPQTGAQWRNADIATFLSGGPNSWGITVRGKVPTEYWIGAVNVVWRSLTEHRLATAYVNAGTDGFAGMVLANPVDHSVATWAKAAATTYLALFYLTGDGGSSTLNGIDQASLAENPGGALTGWTGADQPTVTSAAGTSAVPVGAISTSTWAPSVLLSTSAPAESVDSQPYVIPKVMRVASGDALGDDAEKLAAHATANYAMAHFVVGMFDENGQTIVPDGDLTVQIVSSVFAPVGGTITVSPGDIPSDGRWHLVADRLSSAAALASGSVYYLAFTTTSTVPWTVGYLDIVNAAAVGPAVEAGGIVNTATGTTDLLSNVGTVPAALTGFTSVVSTVAQVPAPGCGPVNVSFVQLDWTASALGGAFGYYEVQRASDGGPFYTIAKVTSEADNAYTDRECLRNLPEQYRVRVVRADGAPSDWTTGSPVTATTALGCDLILVAGSGILAYGESGGTVPLHTFARANSQAMVSHLIAGRQAPVGFRPLIEGDSDVFQRTLIVNVDEPGANLKATDPGGLDRFPFDPLLSLIEDTTVPYVALCDGHGRRWFTFAEFVQGSYAPIGHAHLADVKFTEVSIVPIAQVLA